MNLKPSSSKERKQLFIETLLNATDKVSKVSHHSALDGIATGVAKIAGKVEKDIILALSELFPDLAFGELLDRAAKNFGVSDRMGALGSSTYVRIKADAGTTYVPGQNTFTSTDGLSFNLSDTIVVPQEGFTYAKVSSVDVGAKTNVSPLSISKVTPEPSGHKNVVNEVQATGGRDIEDDQMLRARIKDSGNLFATGTISMIEQLAILANPKVLRVFNYGSAKGKQTIAIATQNGVDLTTTELAELADFISPFLTLTDSQFWGTKYFGINFINITYAPIDISFRALLDNTQNPDSIRQEIQISISKYLDFRTFDPRLQKVEWDNLLEIVKNTKGVKYVPDQFFFPRTDIAVNAYKLPRLRGFLMLDMEGQVISNLQGTLSPVFYPAQADFNYLSTVLQKL